MRLTITFRTALGSIKLPVHYNHILQAFIYDNISPELATFLHEKGYIYGKRSFKLFTFSRLCGKFRLSGEVAEGSREVAEGFSLRKEARDIRFESPVKLQIASSDTHFVQEFAENLLRKGNLFLSEQPIIIDSIEVHPNPKFSKGVVINTLSPITVYSTLKKQDGSKKTYYYSPYEQEFSQLITENLKKKFTLIYSSTGASPLRAQARRVYSPLIVSPISVKEKILKYKNTVIKGWAGRFKLKGAPELISVAYDTGLGSKNSQGFGMFEMVR